MTASTASILLVGLPETGKTNYLARLWASLREGKSAVTSTPDTGVIKYVEDAVAHLLEGAFAGRTTLDSEDQSATFRIPVRASEGTIAAELVVPDVNGEMWRDAVEDSEISHRWHDELCRTSMALLFVRARSPLNHMPLDWVVSDGILTKITPNAEVQSRIPTQVYLCQLLRFLETTLGQSEVKTTRRVAVVVTAWDRLDAQQRAQGPWRYLESEFPLFFGALKNSEALDIDAFGVSIVGGDLTDDPGFKADFLANGDVHASGYVMHGTEEQADVTIPIAWLLRK